MLPASVLTKNILRFVKRSFMRPIRVFVSLDKHRTPGGKRALLCYITRPFKTRRHDRIHPNLSEVRMIARILEDLGYDVWAVDYHSEYPIDYTRYDLIFGFGRSFSRSFDGPFHGIRILHLTGASPCFSNRAEPVRLLALHQRKEKLLSPRRIVYEPWMAGAVLSDAVFCLGNDWSLSTYQGINTNLIRIPVSYVPTHELSSLSKDYEAGRKRFLWFGSLGAVHKGLDLVLDAMDILGGDYHLDVCGSVESETDFFALYRDHLLHRKAISYHGFVDVSSQTMKNILERCNYTILPSCSEGGGSSVLTCMHGGLIPLVTQESSVDLEDFGILIDQPTPEAVADAMRQAAALPTGTIRSRAQAASAFVNNKHSAQQVEAALRASLSKIIQAKTL